MLISFSVLGKKLSKETISVIQCSYTPLWRSAPPIFPARTGTSFPDTAQKSLGHGRSVRQDFGNQSSRCLSSQTRGQKGDSSVPPVIRLCTQRWKTSGDPQSSQPAKVSPVFPPTLSLTHMFLQRRKSGGSCLCTELACWWFLYFYKK